jgi:hypothetical protein
VILVDLDQPPAAAARREADHQQGLEAELCQQRRLLLVGVLVEA